MPLITTAARLTRETVALAASDLHLDERTIRYQGHPDRTQYVIGHVHVEPFASRWRDLGEGPSWQEEYALPMSLKVELLWEPGAHQELRISYPVVSILREGGAKFAGVSVSARNERDPRPSVHHDSTWEFSGAQEIAERSTFFEHRVVLQRGVGTQSVPFDHDPSRSRYVLTFITR
jgi:hypothetical protein